MAKLTAKQESFITLMGKSEEHARRGFDVLLARPGYEKMFDALTEAGLFNPVNNPPPVPAGEPGYVRIPYWDALNYLEGIAKLSGERNDTELANKVLNIVKAVSEASEENHSACDNYHTNRKFAEILGLVPTICIADAYLDLIPLWLKGKYDRGMVCHALDKGAMHRLLASPSPNDWIKAVTILRHCTVIVWINENFLVNETRKPVSIVENHWLKKLISRHASELGKKVGRATAELFIERLRETFDQDRRNLPSWVHRPAVEDHAQNHEWFGPENRFVEGLRDVLLSWLDTDPATAKAFIKTLLTDNSEIVRRISLHLIDRKWDAFGELCNQTISKRLFEDGHLHELYWLLRNHFESFSESAKSATIQSIQELQNSTTVGAEYQQLKRIQRNWLSAVSGKGYAPADDWFKSLLAEDELGGLSEHPDFYSYMQFQRGPGSSPYQVQELLAIAEFGNIVERLNGFQEIDTWRGPTVRALVDSLKEAVTLAPNTFLQLLPKFLSARRPYQFAVIEGFRHLCTQGDQNAKSIDWDMAWEKMTAFFEQVIGEPQFWAEVVVEDSNWTPNRDWIPPVIADCIKAGTINDEKAYPPSLLPRTWAILRILLERLSGTQDAPSSNATDQAINSPRGKTLEALFIHALRECRVSDQTGNGHSKAWEAMAPTFDVELSRCENGNFEFSTLAGNYLPNLEYMSPEWLRTNIERIYPSEFRDNFKCALDGLSYATVSDSLYDLLITKGVVDRALREQELNQRVRERLIERIAFAYLWNKEQLDSPRFSYIFRSNNVEDLAEASGWFWSIREEQLSPEHVTRILQFWDRCVSWSRDLSSPPTKLLSSLSRLSCYLQHLTQKETEWLLAVAPYVSVDYNYDFFLEELDRLAETSPTEVSTVMMAFLDSYVPDYDFEDKLKSIIKKLAYSGKRHDALKYAEKLRHLSGMLEVYTDLFNAGSGTKEK